MAKTLPCSYFLFSALFWLIFYRILTFDGLCIIPVNPVQWVLAIGSGVLKACLSDFFPSLISFYLDADSTPFLWLSIVAIYFFKSTNFTVSKWKRLFLLAVPILLAHKQYRLYAVRDELKHKLDSTFPFDANHIVFSESRVEEMGPISVFLDAKEIFFALHSMEEKKIFSFSKSLTNYFQPPSKEPIHQVILYKSFTPKPESNCLTFYYKYSPSKMFSENRRALERGKLFLDFYKPKTQSLKPTPVMILIHGGGWKGGDKRLLRPLYGGGGYPGMLLKNGIAFVSISYRLVCTGANAYEVMEDIRDAIYYLRDHAVELNIDPEKIVISGSSAGAHLGMLTVLRYKTNVKGFVSLHGPTESRNREVHSKASTPYEIISSYVFLNEIQALCRDTHREKCISDLSVVENVKQCNKEKCPPMLLLHGQNDPLVPLSQPTELSKALTKRNISNVLLDVPCASHNCEIACSSSCAQIAMFSIARFLNHIF